MRFLYIQREREREREKETEREEEYTEFREILKFVWAVFVPELSREHS